MIHRTFLVALSATVFAFPALAQQDVPAPAEPPKAAQQAPTLAEKAGRVIDKVSGMPVADADVDMRRVIAAHQSLAPKPLDQIDAVEARKQPTFADAVKDVLRKEGKDPAQLAAEMGVKTVDMTYTSATATLPVRIYTPEHAGTDPLPIIVYYHGGGFVIADLDTYDATPRSMAKLAKAIVVSVEYRKAPENKFPAAHEDAIAAYRWVLDNASTFNGDNNRIAVMGESAGGNLAINVAIAARDQNFKSPIHQVLIYPLAGVDLNTESYRQNEFARPLNKAAMRWFFDQVLKTPADRENSRLDIVGKANLTNLPSATVITAEIDPLMSEGKFLADKLGAAGVKTRYQNFEGVTHEFFGASAAVAKAGSAQTLVAQQLTEAFNAKKSASVQ